MTLPTLPDTTDGRIHRAVSWQLYQALVVSTGTGGATDRSRAITLAKQCDIITGQKSRIQDHAGAMYTANANLIMMPYTKSVEYPNGQNSPFTNANIGQLPYQWYSHNSWTGDISLESKMVQNSSIHVMMGDTTNDGHGNTGTDPNVPSTWWKVTLNDPLGSNVAYYEWKELISKWTAAEITVENNRYSNTPWRGIWFDSAGSFAYSTGNTTPIQRNGSAYASAPYDFLNTAVWPVGDQAQSDNPNLIIWMNGLPSFDNSQSDIASHVHGVMAEGVFHNASDIPTNAYPTEGNWISICNHMQKMQVSSGTISGGYNKYVQLLEYCTGSAWATATWNNYRRFFFASYHFMNRGKLIAEMYRGTSNPPGAGSSLAPYLEYGQDPSLYDLTMGVALDTQNDVTNYAVGGQANLYARRFNTGLVLLNFSGSSRTFTADRTYTLVNMPGVTTTTVINSGSGIVVPPLGADGTGVVTARFYTTTAQPPTQPYQDRITSQQGVFLTGSAVTAIAVPSATDTYTTGGQSFRSTWEVGNFSEYTSHTGSQITVKTGHAHTGTQAAQILIHTSGASYAQKNLTAATGLYVRIWFSVVVMPNGAVIFGSNTTSGSNNQPTIRVQPSGKIDLHLAPKSGSATADQIATLYTLDPVNDIGDYFRVEWFADFTNGTTGRLHGWLYNATGGLLGSTGTSSGNTTATPLTFTGTDYVQSTITQLRAGMTNSTPTNGEVWIDEVGYNATALGKVGA